MLFRTAFRRRGHREVSVESWHLLGGLQQWLQICEGVRTALQVSGRGNVLVVRPKAILVPVLLGCSKFGDGHDRKPL